MSVGIVVPTLGDRSRLGYLDEAVRSIQDQGGVDVRLVVSTVAPSVEQLRALLPGVTVVAQSGRGIAAAIEHGWAQLPADVEYVAWLGDDDRLVPDSLRQCERAFVETPAGLVCAR